MTSNGRTRQDSSLKRSQSLENYDIGRVIGKGGFSKVHLAVNRKTGKRTVLKLTPFTASATALFRRNGHESKNILHNLEKADKLLVREVQILSYISKNLNRFPHIIGVYESFVHSNALQCIVMEVARWDLRKVVSCRYQAARSSDHFSSEAIINEEELQCVMSQLFDALSALHKSGIVHRDIKASNVLLVPKTTMNAGSQVSCVPSSVGMSMSSVGALSLVKSLNFADFMVKVSDFGLAVQMRSDQDWMTCQRTLCGTPNCLAPEIAHGVLASSAGNPNDFGSHGIPVDLWSAGCLMYYLISGRYPFASNSEEDILKRIILGTWSYPAHINVNEESSSLLNQLLSINPIHRGTSEHILLQHPFFVKTGEAAVGMIIDTKESNFVSFSSFVLHCKSLSLLAVNFFLTLTHFLQDENDSFHPDNIASQIYNCDETKSLQPLSLAQHLQTSGTGMLSKVGDNCIKKPGRSAATEFCNSRIADPTYDNNIFRNYTKQSSGVRADFNERETKTIFGNVARMATMKKRSKSGAFCLFILPESSEIVVHFRKDRTTKCLRWIHIIQDGRYVSWGRLLGDMGRYPNYSNSSCDITNEALRLVPSDEKRKYRDISSISNKSVLSIYHLASKLVLRVKKKTPRVILEFYKSAEDKCNAKVMLMVSYNNLICYDRNKHPYISFTEVFPHSFFLAKRTIS